MVRNEIYFKILYLLDNRIWIVSMVKSSHRFHQPPFEVFYKNSRILGFMLE